MSSTTNTAAAEYGNFATKLNGDNPQGYKTMTTKNTKSVLSTIQTLDFSDLKNVRENLKIEGSENVFITFNGIAIEVNQVIISQLVKAGFYHSLADETAKVKAGTPEKSNTVKTILTRWNNGFFTAKDERDSKNIGVNIAAKSGKTPAFGRNEILGVMADNALVSATTIESLRGYTDELWSVFLIKNMENPVLKSVYALLNEAATAKAKQEFESKAAQVIEL
jgi:hypothetical protein